MIEISPSIPDVSGLTENERTVLHSLQELQMLSGIDASSEDVERHIAGIISAVAGLSQMAITIAREDPQEFKRLSTIVQYIGAMLWEWHLRREDNARMLQKVEEFGRASARIGHGLFPLDDAAHPIHQ